MDRPSSDFLRVIVRATLAVAMEGSIGVTQHEHPGHLTTEQLSAFLDKQLTLQEQAFFDAHLQVCSQCQQALAELRRTVVLLRAMPRIDVPRSFTLPTVIRPVPLRSASVN